MVKRPVRFSDPRGRGGERLFDPRTGRTISGGRRKKPPAVSSKEEQNRIFEQFRAGQLSRAQAISRLRGAAAQKAFEAKQAAEAKAVRAKALAESARRTKERAKEARLRRKIERSKVLTRRERLSLIARQNLTKAAAARGRGFTKREFRKFIEARGGSTSALKRARAKGFKVEEKKPTKKAEDIEKIQQISLEDLKPSDAIALANAGYTRENLKLFGEKLKGAERIHVITSRKAREITDKIKEGKIITPNERMVQLAAQFAIPLQRAGLAVINIPSSARDIIKDPKSLTKVPANIFQGLKRDFVEIKELAFIDPASAIARIGGEVVVLKGTQGGFKVAGKITGKALTKVNPFLKRVKAGKLTIKTTRGKTILTTGKAVKKIAEPLPKQVKIAGKRVTAVSAQADRLVNFIKRKRIIRKPIPGEANFAPRIKRLLKKFDDGKITKRELIKLQSEVPVLERSFFADPRGRFRPSRLGLQPQKDATLLDIIKGDFTFKTQKPQILVFENVKVAKFPKDLDDVAKALKAGKSLTNKQSKRLLDWQTKKTGQFKPIGALTKEPEITLAPGEIIKKVKKRGTALINGKKVDITEVKIVKPKASTKKLLTKAKNGKISNVELKRLANNLKKETGFDSSLSRGKIGKPKFRFPKRITRIKRKVRVAKRVKKPVRKVRVAKRVKKTIRRVRVAKRVKKTIRKAKPVKRVPSVKRITRAKKRPSRITKTPKRPTPPSRKRTTKRREAKIKVRLRKNGKGFDVFAKPIKTKSGKKAKRFLKVNKIALSKPRAEDLRNYITDTSLSRTAKLKASKKKPSKPRLKVPRGYAKRSRPKFRTYRIVKGKRRKLKSGKVIERKTRLLDTRQERKRITLRKRIKQITKPKKKGSKVSKKKRKLIRKPLTASKLRQQRLKNLEKARAKRLQKLKRRKK